MIDYNDDYEEGFDDGFTKAENELQDQNFIKLNCPHCFRDCVEFNRISGIFTCMDCRSEFILSKINYLNR